MNTTTSEPLTVQPRELSRDGHLPDSTLVVDVRTPGEYREAHLAGTMLVPLGDVESSAADIARAAAGRPVTLVCRTGKRAEEARKALARAGVTETRCLAGGLEGWRAAGLPVVTGKAGMSLERQVRIVAGALVVIGAVLGWTVHPYLHGLSAFVGAGLVFAGVTDTCGMAMVLARMPWNRGVGDVKSCSV